jgi:type I restriction-modification system DNA methylase subunit
VPAPAEIKKLVERFTLHREEYVAGNYNETQLRREFIDPMFKALGWDIDNESGNAEAYKDVIHEDAIKIGGFTKAPDYCFRIGGTRKFFLEAKKPAENIEENREHAYQLKRYAWSAKLPLSILTNFGEFAVYDCRFKPEVKDKASKARVKFIRFEEYLDRWDEIASIFSREAVLKGSFDRYADSTKSKRGTGEVDTEFLKEIEEWRLSLARNLALRNPDLDQRGLNFAVQRIIDRLIFLRIAEDRGIEDYGQLQALLNGAKVYARMAERFRAADDRYNSGLFHFTPEKGRQEPPDEFTLALKIDDDTLKEIIRNLYYPDSPYEFSVLPADILGQVYEQFLGKVIRLTTGHQAKVEEKPEVKKAGGVYYTPTYIVDYIVKQTVGRLLEGKTPKQVATLKVLDPACGSGSFLIGAYQFLLDWHRKWYESNSPQDNPKHVYTGRNGEWILTTAERKRILLSNIYGVDIDSQAVEVTKLSLLLKVLEGENRETLERQRKLFHERALPDLGSNIKCGNSLIGHDFYDANRLDLFPEEERLRLNTFEWKDEFADIVTSGGFDVVIGNPPYIFTREQIPEAERRFFATHFTLGWEKHNTYMLFMELLLRLVKPTGLGGFIVPNSWLTIESGRLLREALIERLHVVADLNYPAFDQVSMEPCVFVISGRNLRSDVEVLRVSSKEEFHATSASKMKRSVWKQTGSRIVVSTSVGLLNVLEKMHKNSIRLESDFDVRTGLQAYERGKGHPPQSARDVRDHVFDRQKREDQNSIRYLGGRDVARYHVTWSGMWMQYGPWLSQPREIEMFTRPRVLVREITAPLPHCLHAAFTDEQFLNNKSILNVLHPEDSVDELKALTCVLNSRLMSAFYKNHAVKGARTIFPKVVIKNLREFPIPLRSRQTLNQLAILIDTLSLLNRKRIGAKTPHEQEAVLRQVVATDRQIDQLVYELYGLTDAEIALVEEATAR